MIGLSKMQFSFCWDSLIQRLNPRIVTSAVTLTLACAISAAAYYYQSRKEINDVMIFCKLQFNVYNYFDKLMSFVESAKHSVNVCMPSIHNPAIQGRLVELIKRKNIKARIIIDHNGCNEFTAFLLKELVNAGAEIRWKVSDSRLQHKFCLVDDEILMTGTLDWGNDLSCNNWNYVYVTSKTRLVDPVKKEFYLMWDKCQAHLEELANQWKDNEQANELNEDDNKSNNSEELDANALELSNVVRGKTPEISIKEDD